ncbi:RuBisCO large subunit C-terminal-like domain-containing protein [Ancylothrix sp. C2]|uniref:RuBisCO large subunit C-terminal-like domain-containing protein n=1 Tax=Ancylothrix sp. D3o TaxID=2953691 RepID=UPI0021BA64E6|nr:RuBisCO large subunit C-terminal-like domain-containing protein [Ancylothrix sp. D3o]MCT7948720.1 RuBisCO large subunit C-terminal-like domain-containing protein [Ancylothrix sp. D3o]
MFLEVDYQFTPEIDPNRQAKIIAIGQTAGTWDTSFSHRETTLKSHLAEVGNIRTEATGHHIATIHFPLANIENDIPSLLTMIFGKYSMAGPAKVIAVRLPENYGKKPKLGITGIRQHLKIYDRPLIMAIFKPALGLTAEDHAAILKEVAFAGLDIIKDDEIMGDIETAPTLQRLKACRQILDQLKQQTGRTVLYATNVTGPNPLDMAKRLVQEGANALLFNALTYGFSALEQLTSDPEINVPIFAHPALAGALCAAPDHGFAYSVILGTFMAHSGTDAVLYPAHYGNLPFQATEEQKIRDFLRQKNVFPVPSAGIHPGIVPKVLADYGNDVILNAGTGIMDHPDNPASGVQAFFEALEKTTPNQPFDLETLPAGPLRRAVEKWGNQ